MTARPAVPRADRPHMPGYGIEPAPAGRGLLPWAWAEERLAAARNYWLATAGAGGEPHLAAVWGVWADGRLVFSTGGRSRKARDLEANPRCAVSTEDGDESVVVQGRVERVDGADAIAAIAAIYQAKYGSGFPDPAGNPLLAVRPSTVIAVVEASFTTAATRWTFAS
jgi:general stress protein 26